MTGYALAGAMLALTGVGWLAFGFGRELAERDAWRQVNALRADVARYRLENNRLKLRNETLTRTLDSSRGPIVEIPAWVNESGW